MSVLQTVDVTTIITERSTSLVAQSRVGSVLTSERTSQALETQPKNTVLAVASPSKVIESRAILVEVPVLVAPQIHVGALPPSNPQVNQLWLEI